MRDRCHGTTCENDQHCRKDLQDALHDGREPGAPDRCHDGAYNAGEAIGRTAYGLGKGLVDLQREEEIHQANLRNLNQNRPTPQPQKPQEEYVPYLFRLAKSNAEPTPIDRLVGTRSQPIMVKPKVKHKVRHRKATRHKPASRKSIAELETEVKRLRLAKEAKKLRKSLAEA